MLIDDVRSALKVRSTISDTEIEIWISAAIEDLRRCGVREELLQRETMDSLVRSAVVLYCKANYGFDNSDSDRNYQWYERTRVAICNSSKNESLYEVEDGKVE